MNRLKRMQFWGRHPDDDYLVLEVLRGEKTATVCKADKYFLPEGEFDDGGWEIDDLVEVYDLRGRLRCIVRVTDLYKVRFGEIPDRLWLAEACRNAEHFKQAHRECWPQYNLTDDFEMMATHFELVEIK
ncbi:MAG: ASCH domain-containing protein [Candidatus Eisenbacteria bacterium]|nr:ASCH domain-containing protein [Candidatus Eisenbacteria bacterium]